MKEERLVPYVVTGILAHQRPKGRIDITRIIYARDPVMQ